MTPPASDHFNGKTFFQPGAHPERGFRDFLHWRFTSRPTPWPAHVALAPQPPPPQPSGDRMVVTWLGHASFLVQTAAGNLLFDPVFSDRVSPFRLIGPRRVHPVPMRMEQLPKIDVVCVSHDHYDHFDGHTLKELASRFDPLFVAPLRHHDLLARAGAQRIVELDWWQAHSPNPNLKITLTPTKHWSNRLGTPRNYRLWGGFWVEVFSIGEPGARDAMRDTGCEMRDLRAEAIRDPRCEIRETRSDVGNTARSLWFVGDTGYDEPLFRDIRRRLGSPDVALVPIGAYEPRWFMAPMHVNPEEAVRLHCDVSAKVSIAMHWGTFHLTDEAREAPVEALKEARLASQVTPEQFRVLAPGESVVL